MRPHSNANHRYLRNPVAALDLARFDMRRDGFENFQYPTVIVPVNSERKIGEPVVSDVLHNHIDVDVGVPDGSEYLVSNSWPVRDPENRNFCLIAVESDA